MTRKTFSEEQIVYALRQAEAGTPVVEVCRKLGVTEQTFYRWKRQVRRDGDRRAAAPAPAGGREPAPQAAGRRPDPRQAHAAGGHPKTTREAGPAARPGRVPAGRLRPQRAARLPGRSVSAARSSATAASGDDQAPLRLRLRDLAATRVRYGYRRLHVLLQREGWRVNHKRVYRLYRLEGLSLRRKARKKRLGLPRVPRPAPTPPQREWGMDFLADRLADGRRFRVLTLVDHVSRVSPAIAVGGVLDRRARGGAAWSGWRRRAAARSGSAWTTARSSSPRRWMPGPTAAGCSSSSAARASRPTTRSSRRSTAASGTSASISTGSRRWRRRDRPSRLGGWSTTRSGRIGALGQQTPDEAASELGPRQRPPTNAGGGPRNGCGPTRRGLSLSVDQFSGGRSGGPRPSGAIRS